MLNDALRFLLDHLHIIVPSVLGLWFLTTFLSSEEAPVLRTGPCPRCDGDGQVLKTDPLSGERYRVGCPACKGIGQVRDYQTFVHDVYHECQACDATGFRTVIDGPRFPDGSAAPGARLQTVQCDQCVDGWIAAKGQVAAKRIVPFSHPPPPSSQPVVPPAMLIDEEAFEDELAGDEDEPADLGEPIAVPSMFGDDEPPA